MAKKILVVDDDPDLSTYMSTLLVDNGYEVITAKDGNEGLEKVRSEKPDAITLDLLMPEKTGMKMFRELRKDEALKNTPVIMVTGISDEYQAFAEFKNFLAKMKMPGPEAYLEKPINKEDYLATVQKVVGS
jgi:CheY-like chemotaxis protein